MSKLYQTKAKHIRILHRPPPVSGQLDPNPPKSAPVHILLVTNWSPVNRGAQSEESDDDDFDNVIVTDEDIDNEVAQEDNVVIVTDDDINNVAEQEDPANVSDQSVEQQEGDKSHESEVELEDETPATAMESSEELSDGQAEDMIEDFHNLYLHGPQPQGGVDGGAVGSFCGRAARGRRAGAGG